MKVWTRAAGALLILLALAACQPVVDTAGTPATGSTESSSIESSSTESSADTTAGASADNTTADVSTDGSAPVTYSSPAGFSIQIPAAWAGHYRVNELSPEAASALAPTAQSVTQFVYLPVDVDDPEQPVLTIYTFTTAAWAAANAAASAPAGRTLAEANGVVHVGALPQSNPYSIDSPDTAVFEAMVSSVLQAAMTFVTE